MKTTQWFHRLVRSAALLLFASCCVSASASILTFYGRDDGVGPGGARPNADAAFQAYQAAIAGSSATSLITFEGLPVGALPGDVALGLGVTMQPTGDCCVGIISAGSSVEGYNVTAGGSNFLQFVPNLFSGDISVTFTFPTAIRGFGAYVTGSQSLGADCQSTCGSLQLQDVPNNLFIWPGENDSITGGVYFIGFVDTVNVYDHITLKEHGAYYQGPPDPGSQRGDIIGVDNILIAANVPEPSMIALVGLSFFLLASSSRRRVG